MKKWKRSLFFWILVIAFFITAPAVILRARGYRFDFNRGIFVYSGSITIKSNPQDVNIILNGELNESKKIDRINSSAQISSLLPGEYNLEVTAPEFRTWEKTIQVRSGVSTEFWNVLLVRENYEKETYALENSDRFFISPKTDSLASAKQADNKLRIDILNIDNDEILNSFNFDDLEITPRDNQENIEWSPENSQHISVPILRNQEEENSKAKDYLIINLETNEHLFLREFLDITDIDDVRWHPQKENYLFFLSDNKLYQANIEDSQDLTLVSEDVSTFNLSGSYIYFSQSSNQITFRKSLTNFDDVQQITTSLPEGFQGNVKKLIIYDKDRIAFLDEKQNLFIYNVGEKNTYFKKLDSRVEGLHFSNDGKKLLFWNDNEISLYFLRDWEVQPVRQEDTLTNITRYIEPIENVQWFLDYEHVLFNTGPYVKIIELDSRDKRNSMDILTLENNEHFFTFDSLLEKLFFIGENDKLFSIDFPETTGILGF